MIKVIRGDTQSDPALARQVAEAARDTLGYPLHYQDETYSTLEAEERLREQRVPGLVSSKSQLG